MPKPTPDKESRSRFARRCAIAAQQSEYDQNIDLFKENLIIACQQIGVHIDELNDLITDQQVAKEKRKVMDISPDTTTEL